MSVHLSNLFLSSKAVCSALNTVAHSDSPVLLNVSTVIEYLSTLVTSVLSCKLAQVML